MKLFRCSNRYNVILIIINRLSKKRYYIFCDIENEEISVEIIVKMLIQHIWKLHDLSLIIVWNRKFQFISMVWKFLCKILKIVFKSLTTFHFEIDKQSEIANQKIKRHLGIFYNHQQNNWFEILSMTKFAANECFFASIKVFFSWSRKNLIHAWIL